MLIFHHLAREVPAELCHACVPHLPHHCPFALVQGIVADEYEFSRVWECLCQHVRSRFALKPFRDVPVNHAFVGYPFICKGFTIIIVQRPQNLPHPKETFLHVRVLGVRVQPHSLGATEMRHELRNCLALSLGKIFIIILDGLEVHDIGEKHPGIHKIFVQIVEITY